MSKLLNLYKELKKERPDKLYLFKSGIFYLALEEDALVLSELFNFKLIDLNEHSIKCGFPASRISYYSEKLRNNKVDFEIVSSNSSAKVPFTDCNYNSIMQEILNINFDELTFKDAFFKLQKFQNELKKIKS